MRQSIPPISFKSPLKIIGKSKNTGTKINFLTSKDNCNDVKGKYKPINKTDGISYGNCELFLCRDNDEKYDKNQFELTKYNACNNQIIDKFYKMKILVGEININYKIFFQ